MKSTASSNSNVNKTQKGSKDIKIKARINYLKCSDSKFNHENALKREVINKALSQSIEKERFKGYLLLTDEAMKIKSKNKRVKLQFEYDKLKGLYSPSYESSSILLVIDDQDLYYFSILCYGKNDVQAIVHRLDAEKGNDSEQLPFISNIENENYYQGDDHLSLEGVQVNPSMTETYIFDANDISSEDENTRPSESMATERLDNDLFAVHRKDDYSDLDDQDELEDLEGRWLTETIYVSYNAESKSNFPSENGSVYMYSSHQLNPVYDYYESDYSSESD